MLKYVYLIIAFMGVNVSCSAQISFSNSKEVNYFLGDTIARSQAFLRLLPNADLLVKAIKLGKRKKNFPSQEEEDRIIARIDQVPEGQEFAVQDYLDMARVLGKTIYEHNEYLGLRFKASAFKKGFAAGTANTSKFSVAERRKIGSKLAEKAFMAEAERNRRIAQRNLIRGEDFLEKNKSKAGVTVLPSGLQYEVIEKGTGKSPLKRSKVTVHYKGSLLDGTVFDNSYDRGQPVRFSLWDMIKGWQQALPLMKEGAKWKLYIPGNLAYGDRGYPGMIPPNATLVFEIELLKVE